MAVLQTDTMKARLSGKEPEADPGHVPVPSSTRRRTVTLSEDNLAQLERDRIEPSDAPVPFEPLTHDELAGVGSLAVRARSNGMDIEAYVAELRAELAAWDRLVVLEGE